jgi:hypothetical protein
MRSFISIIENWKPLRVLVAFAAIFLGGAGMSSVIAQNVEKDSTEWVGEWRDEGNLQYAFRLKMKPIGDGQIVGVFEWKLIWTSLEDHRPKVGAIAKEHVVGRYNAADKTFDLVGVRQEDPADIISMDHYIIHLSADGKRIEGINIKPTNYQGSMFGVILERKAKPVTAVSKSPQVKNVTTKPAQNAAVKIEPKPQPAKPTPTPVVAKPAQPQPAALASKELDTREIVTKTEIHAAETQVSIRIFDESIVDGDVVSLSWNGVWVLRYYRVAKLPKEITLDLQLGENTLVMHAENLGKYPPNTAAITVQRGSKTEQIILNSDMGKSEAIKFIRD